MKTLGVAGLVATFGRGLSAAFRFPKKQRNSRAFHGLNLDEMQAVTDEIWLPGIKDNWAQGNLIVSRLLDKAHNGR